MIYKDHNGMEFNVSPETFINPSTGKSVTTNTDIKPILNPEGKQVKSPVTLNYEFLGEQDVSELGGDYPYLYFGSQFANEEIIPLPTVYSNVVDYAQSVPHIIHRAVDEFGSQGFEISKDVIAESDTMSLTDFVHILAKEFISNTCTNILAIYNNNLRMILDIYLNGDNKDILDLCIDPLKFKTVTVMESLLGNESEPVPVPRLQGIITSPVTISYFSEAVSCCYNSLITSLLKKNAIDFYSLAKSRIDKDHIQVPPEFYYSYGVDIVREIANMEIGRNINLIEINLMHMNMKFTDFLKKYNGIYEVK